jgi:hypothetical protein
VSGERRPGGRCVTTRTWWCDAKAFDATSERQTDSSADSRVDFVEDEGRNPGEHQGAFEREQRPGEFAAGRRFLESFWKVAHVHRNEEARLPVAPRVRR